MPKYRDEWWHTDAKGHRVGWLYPDDLQDFMTALYGEREATARRFAYDIGVDPSKVSRWLSGKDPIPKMVAQLVALSHAHPKGPRIPSPKAPWLPATDSVNGRNEHLPQEKPFRKVGRPRKGTT